MSDLLIAPGDIVATDLAERVALRLAAFDCDDLPGLSASQGPWSLAEPACPNADSLLTAWLHDERPGASVTELARAACGRGMRALLTHATDRDDGAVHDALTAAGEPSPVAGETLHVAAVGSVLLGDGDLFRAAHAAADRLLDRFERRKHPFGLTGHGKDAADLAALGLLRATWRVLTQVTGDPRFLNAALKLAEWTRRTLPDADLSMPEPWHGLRAVLAVDRHTLSVGATALHLLAVERERAAVRALEVRR